MADSTPYTKTHFPFSESSSRIQPKPINKGKSCSSFLFKYLFLALLVIVLPLFPSQAPDFVNQTILTKFWELLHLLFIGIAVAYGLFSRRNVELETPRETHSNVDSAPSYVSKMFPDPTVFGYGGENPCGYEEKRVMHCWNPQYFEGGPGVVCSNGGTVGVLDEQYKTQLPISDDNFCYPLGCDGNNVVQAWNSEYYHSEPVAVVAQPCYNTGECGEFVGYKPLGLPVRSLRSVAREVDNPKYTNESDSSSGSRGSSKSSVMSRDREFGDLGPSNLEEIFNDAATVGGSASQIPWRSRSRRMGRERRHGNVTRPSHFRPLSVDETKFEALNSRSLQSTTSFSAPTSMYSSVELISSDSMNYQEEEMTKKEASYVPASENMNFQEVDMRLKKTSYVPASENMNFQEEDMGQRKTSYVPASENMNFQEEGMGQRRTSYVPALENMNFQEEDMGQRRTSYVPALENMNFQEEDMGQRRTSHFPALENMNFQEEDMGQRNTSHFPASENMNLQEVDLGKKISKVSSSRNGRMATKGKYAAVSYPSHFRPMSVDETQFESLSSQSFPSVGPVSSQVSMYSSMDSISSDNLHFQEEDIGQKKTSHVRASEQMNFPEENMGKKKTSYVHASENVNFPEEDMRQKKTSYVPAMNFQEVDLGRMVSEGSSSRNGRMETKGKCSSVSQPTHLRPMSADETQFESLSSRSFQSMGSFSSQTSICSSLDSVSSENTNLLKEDLGEKKSSHGSSYSSSPSPSARRNEETSLQPFHDRGYSNGSLLQNDMKSNLNDDMRGLNVIGGEDPQGNKELGMHALQSDSGKPASVAKAPSRGKSVRTRRGSGPTSGTMRIGEISSKETDEKVEKKPNNAESVLMRKDKVKSGEPDLLLKGNGKKTLDSCHMPEVTFSNHHKRDKLEPFKNVSNEDLDIKLENIQVSSDEDRMSECVNDSGLDSEVDKKASEFIAKFKAQIRLQKMGSIERSKGQKTIGNSIR